MRQPSFARQPSLKRGLKSPLGRIEINKQGLEYAGGLEFDLIVKGRISGEGGGAGTRVICAKINRYLSYSVQCLESPKLALVFPCLSSVSMYRFMQTINAGCEGNRTFVSSNLYCFIATNFSRE